MADTIGTMPRRNGGWTWTLASGVFTILLALIAAALPLVEWAPQGGLVGWLLLLAGLAEFAFGTRRGTDYLGSAAMLSGLLTAGAGLLFVVNPFAGYFPVANVVMLWLLVRGAMVLAFAFKETRSRIGAWLALSGAADLLFGIALLAGLSISMLVVTLFGPTPEIVAKLSFILALSFLFTGISQIAIAGVKRHQAGDYAET